MEKLHKLLTRLRTTKAALDTATSNKQYDLMNTLEIDLENYYNDWRLTAINLQVEGLLPADYFRKTTI